MMKMVRSFNELQAEQQPLAGGKGGTLAHLRQAGYPVPDGFVILPDAFDGEELKLGLWEEIQAHLTRIRKGDGSIAFAVRSSALSEDSAQASFGGQFETVLDVRSDNAIHDAVLTVRRSRLSERVQAYSQAKGMDFSHEIAVVVQELVQSEIAGVLFTADPLTGSRAQMTGSFVYGLGDKLVSGEADAQAFTLEQPRGRYDGPPELRGFARKLYKLGSRLEKDLGCPQDIEWAIAGGKLYLLQSRPITTLQAYDPITGVWNDSLSADYLWSSHITGEVLQEYMMPGTLSVWQILFERMSMGKVPGIGVIGGRAYTNVSALYSLLKTFMPRNKVYEILDSVGGVPEELEIPLIPLSLNALLFDVLLAQLPIEVNKQKLNRDRADFIARAPERCRKLQQQIRETKDRSLLISLWHEEILPLFVNLHALQDSSNEKAAAAQRALKRALVKLLGESEAAVFQSTASASADDLASLGQLVGIAKIARGEMTREEYIAHYGHRGPYEDYLEYPRPAEEPGWLDRQLEEYEQFPVDVEALLKKRRADFLAAWEEFQECYPGQVKSIKRKVDDATETAHEREAVRTELTRVFGVMRDWFLWVGELTGLGNDVFFLSYQELMDILSGDDSATVYIPTRREAYEQYRSLPPYPLYIRGRFDPLQWAAEPDRRSDVYDSCAPVYISVSDAITGYAGSAGRVEGIVRRIDRPEEGHQLQPGEILVAVATNIGWTPIFPKAAAVVTDVGSPLSHAAIVARELGIPAVVGCTDATTRLKTGNRVRVDGGRGIVEILDTDE